jgi:hypothetical protein
MEDTMSITINKNHAEEFVSALWNKIADTGFNTLSKNDIYDYILYLFNKYGDIHFLDEKSNYENAVLLKVPETKIKSSKLNIAIKYKTPEERRVSLIRFFQKLSRNPEEGGIRLDADETSFYFTVEDPLVRVELANLLKTQTGTTLDTSFNKEKASIEKARFLELLKTLSGKQDGAFLEILNKQLKSGELANTIKTGVVSVLKILVNNTKLTNLIDTGIITPLIKTLFPG